MPLLLSSNHRRRAVKRRFAMPLRRFAHQDSAFSTHSTLCRCSQYYRSYSLACRCYQSFSVAFQFTAYPSLNDALQFPCRDMRCASLAFQSVLCTALANLGYSCQSHRDSVLGFQRLCGSLRIVAFANHCFSITSPSNRGYPQPSRFFADHCLCDTLRASASALRIIALPLQSTGPALPLRCQANLYRCAALRSNSMPLLIAADDIAVVI